MQCMKNENNERQIHLFMWYVCGCELHELQVLLCIGSEAIKAFHFCAVCAGYWSSTIKAQTRC